MASFRMGYVGVFPEREEYWHVLWFGFLQEDDVGIGVAADQTELGAVERPVKVNDLLRFEVGELLSRGTVERLEPEVFRVLVP